MYQRLMDVVSLLVPHPQASEALLPTNRPLDYPARLQSICPPGGVCVSRAVHDRGGDRLGLKFEELGPLTLKNLARQVEAFVLRFDQDRTVQSVPKIAGPAHIGMGTIRHAIGQS